MKGRTKLMQGIEISRRYYEQYGREMIAASFPEYEGRIAAGLAGQGSDCFGFDDETSRDHDFGAGFCLWLDDADYDEIGFALSRAYAALPKTFEGVKKAVINPGGDNHYGVMRISDFFLPLTGSAGAPESIGQWLNVPEYSLAAATNGEVFRDDTGKFTAIRKEILTGMPEDVKLKKIAAKTIRIAQSGQYNFPRCLAHGEKGAAALALAEFAKEAASLAYLLSGQFCPFYKWALKGLGRLNCFSFLEETLNTLLTEETDSSQIKTIEETAAYFASYFRNHGLSECRDNFLEPHAYEIRNKIRNPILRNAHIMEG